MATELTFATWNIGASSAGAGDDARFRRQMAVLAELRPSVAAIQECKHWDRGNFRTLYLAEHLLGMRGFVARSGHHGCHLAIFVREGAGLRVTEQRHERGDPWWHGVACVLAEAQGFPVPLQLASCHLAPASPQRRLGEAESFTLIAGRGLLIAGGDWNAVPAGDPQPPGPAEGKDRRKLDRRPAEALAEAGLVDAGAHAGDLTPTVGHARGLAYRCDRLYTTLPAQAVIQYQVITSADGLSDHRPVITGLDLGIAAAALAA
jgi:endonuclease/exonuclease/phosphatase family metal-dependent hydrolase